MDMEYYNSRICVSKEELLRSDDGEAIMTLEMYKYYVKKNQVKVVRRGGGKNIYALVDYESLPPKYKDRYVAKYGDPKELLKSKPEPIIVEFDSKAQDYYSIGYYKETGIRLSEDKIREYTMNASAMNWIIRYINERIAYGRKLGGRAKNIYEDAVEKLKLIDEHTLPSSVSRLKAIVSEYKKRGYSSLVSGKIGNANTIKLAEDAQEWVIAMKRSKTPVYSEQRIFEKYNAIAESRGWKQLKSLSTITNFLKRPEVQIRWYDAVHGELAAKQKYNRQHRTKMPSMRDSLWYGDGTKLNLYYKAVENGKTVVRTTNVYEVMDAYSEVFLGYFIDDSEDFKTQYNAFRMAVETAGRRPHEIVVDNQGGHKKLVSAEFFEMICRIQRYTAPYNGQSKTIESAFGRFQKQVLSQLPGFTGMNITARSAKSRVNMEFVADNKDNLPTLEELKTMYANARNEWNWMAHPKTKQPRMEMYLHSDNPETPAISKIEMVNMFWLQTDKPSTYTNSGIEIQVNNQKYAFEVYDGDQPDLNFLDRNNGRKFFVKFDPSDMTTVRLYSQNGQGELIYMADAKPYYEVHRATQEQTQGERSFIDKMDIWNKKRRVQRNIEGAEIEIKHGTAPEQHGYRRPKMRGLNINKVDQWMEELNRSSVKPKVYSQNEALEIGQIMKDLSNHTFDEMAALDKL